MQSVKYVKSWGDPSALLAATSSAASGAPDSDVFGEENKGVVDRVEVSRMRVGGRLFSVHPLHRSRSVVRHSVTFKWHAGSTVFGETQPWAHNARRYP